VAIEVIEELHWEPESPRFDSRCGNLILSDYLILPVVRGSGVYSASNRNEHQRQNYFWGIEFGGCVRPTALPPSVSRLSRQ
jgi:hypothetical protein